MAAAAILRYRMLFGLLLLVGELGSVDYLSAAYIPVSRLHTNYRHRAHTMWCLLFGSVRAMLTL